MKQSKAIRLDEEMAARYLGNGEWYLFAYSDDQGETHEMIRAGHVLLSELACLNLTDAICSKLPGSGCNLLEDVIKERNAMLLELKSLEWIIDKQTVGEDSPELYFCPNCGGYRHAGGHLNECSLENIIQ